MFCRLVLVRLQDAEFLGVIKDGCYNCFVAKGDA